MKQIKLVGIFMLAILASCSQDEMDNPYNEIIQNDSVIESRKPQSEPTVVDIEGTYTCTNCEDLGITIADNSLNLIGISTEGGSGFTTELKFGSTVYSSTNNVVGICETQGKISSCNISGSIVIANQLFSFEGVHQYRDKKNDRLDCNSFTGTWQGTFNGFKVNGTIQSKSPICD